MKGKILFKGKNLVKEKMFNGKSLLTEKNIKEEILLQLKRNLHRPTDCYKNGLE